VVRQVSVVESRETPLELSDQDIVGLREVGRRLASKRQWFGADPPSDRTILTCYRNSAIRAILLVREAIGVIRVGDLQISVQPKIDRKHFLFLAASSQLIPRLDVAETQLAEGKDLWQLIVLWFLQSGETLLRSELSKAYVEREDEIEALRGRLVPLASARRLYAGSRTLCCQFEDFDTDTPLNRIIRCGAEVIAGSPSVDGGDRKRAMRLLTLLADVGSLRPSDLREQVDRRTARYEPALSFARYLIAGSGADIHYGANLGWSFLIRTPELIEAGIRETIARELAPEWSVHKREVPLGSSSLRLRPDLVFGAGVAAGDVKYKIAGADWIQTDLYQIVTFATALKCTAGAVIGFARSTHDPLPRNVSIGDVSVAYFAWNADPTISPTQSAKELGYQVSDWLSTVRARESTIASPGR
jgi:5-methylcytosine-specific restriction enzyme subunit McrC